MSQYLVHLGIPVELRDGEDVGDEETLDTSTESGLRLALAVEVLDFIDQGLNSDADSVASFIESAERLDPQHGARCHLCNRALSEDRKSDSWCEGCQAYICDEHPSEPWGDHEPPEHDAE